MINNKTGKVQEKVMLLLQTPTTSFYDETLKCYYSELNMFLSQQFLRQYQEQARSLSQTLLVFRFTSKFQAYTVIKKPRS